MKELYLCIVFENNAIIIGKKTGENDEEIIVSNPCILVQDENKNTGLMPYLAFSKNGIINIKKSKILITSELEEEYSAIYKKQIALWDEELSQMNGNNKKKNVINMFAQKYAN